MGDDGVMRKSNQVDAVDDASRLISESLQELMYLIVRAGGRLGDPWDRRLTNMQSLALFLVVNEGPVRLGVLAEAMLTTDATATRTVDALALDGLVERQLANGDKRGVLICATTEGRRIYRQRSRRTANIVRSLLEGAGQSQLEEIADFLAGLTETFREKGSV
jgi:DNA-binding MarR family transcriptional regulator